MLSKWPIRVKFLVGLGLLLLLVMILSGSGLVATYSYRSLAKDLSWRAMELPLTSELSRRVGQLRMTLSELRGLRVGAFPVADTGRIPLSMRIVREHFCEDLGEVEDTVAQYRSRLERELRAGSRIADHEHEWATLDKLEKALARVREENQTQNWIVDAVKVDQLDAELENLQTLSAELPSYLYDKLHGFADEVRNQYRTLIVGTWSTSITAGLIFAVFIKLFYAWIFQPLRVLIDGSRKVAAGYFGHRIRLDTQDEMAELADALNDMTARFQAIRDDLDRQVQERTKQVVRSEQLASVGFLAAGVAHEINNPLAAIALCAESLEGRLHTSIDESNPEHKVVNDYLRMIQNEAFRCKEITEKLLDFSRIGQAKRQNTDLGELVQGVIDMLSHLGKYQRKELKLEPHSLVLVPVNPQEIKQVVLNLLTNALDSVEDDGAVHVQISLCDGFAELSVIDNGCGMAPEVLEHVFEPFFTRRREGQGTGLGLSISYRIVADHGGQLEADSRGPGQGATFRVRLPVTEQQKEISYQHRAA